MTDIAQILGQAVDQALAHPAVSLGLHLAAVYLGLVWLSCAWWTFHDLRRRTRDRIAPWLAAAGVLLVGPLGFLPVLAVYLVVRPRETVVDRAADKLEQDLLRAEAQRPRCLACDAPVDPAWVRCPSCGATVVVPCPRCGRNAGLDWEICAWCAADLPWAVVPAPVALPEATPPGVPAVSASIASLREVASSVADGLRRAGDAMLPPTEAVRWPIGALRMDADGTGSPPVPGREEAKPRHSQGDQPPG